MLLNSAGGAGFDNEGCFTSLGAMALGITMTSGEGRLVSQRKRDGLGGPARHVAGALVRVRA